MEEINYTSRKIISIIWGGNIRNLNIVIQLNFCNIKQNRFIF